MEGRRRQRRHDEEPLERLAKISDAYTAMSLRLQSACGLRREESIKIVPAWADGGDQLKREDTWTKGGKYCEIAIRTPNLGIFLENTIDIVIGEPAL